MESFGNDGAAETWAAKSPVAGPNSNDVTILLNDGF